MAVRTRKAPTHGGTARRKCRWGPIVGDFLVLMTNRAAGVRKILMLRCSNWVRFANRSNASAQSLIVFPHFATDRDHRARAGSHRPNDWQGTSSSCSTIGQPPLPLNVTLKCLNSGPGPPFAVERSAQTVGSKELGHVTAPQSTHATRRVVTTPIL
jgi:hypothetical protein